MGYNIHIIHVGKATGAWYSLGMTYLKRMSRSWNIHITAIKDAPYTRSREERTLQETQKVCSLLSHNAIPIELHPEGRLYSSPDFAYTLTQWCENRTKIPTFLIAGTFGFARDLLPRRRELLSLSPMTFTHEMTFPILIEQIYRAYTILYSISYHY